MKKATDLFKRATAAFILTLAAVMLVALAAFSGGVPETEQVALADDNTVYITDSWLDTNPTLTANGEGVYEISTAEQFVYAFKYATVATTAGKT